MTAARSASICWCADHRNSQTPLPESHTSIVGVDVGQRYLAVVATLDNGAQFYSRKAGESHKPITMPESKNDFSEKALAAPPGDVSRWASERDG